MPSKSGPTLLKEPSKPDAEVSAKQVKEAKQTTPKSDGPAKYEELSEAEKMQAIKQAAQMAERKAKYEEFLQAQEDARQKYLKTCETIKEKAAKFGATKPEALKYCKTVKGFLTDVSENALQDPAGIVLKATENGGLGDGTKLWNYEGEEKGVICKAEAIPHFHIVWVEKENESNKKSMCTKFRHSCEPNCWLVEYPLDDALKKDGERFYCLFASKIIKAGEELTWNYLQDDEGSWTDTKKVREEKLKRVFAEKGLDPATYKYNCMSCQSSYISDKYREKISAKLTNLHEQYGFRLDEQCVVPKPENATLEDQLNPAKFFMGLDHAKTIGEELESTRRIIAMAKLEGNLPLQARLYFISFLHGRAICPPDSKHQYFKVAWDSAEQEVRYAIQFCALAEGLQGRNTIRYINAMEEFLRVKAKC